MAFKFSQKNKDVMDFIRAYGSFLAILLIVCALCFAFDLKNINFQTLTIFQSITVKSIGVLIIIVPIIVYYWEKIHLAYTLRRNNLSGFIIERQEIILDIQDEGKFATYLHKIYFHQFNRKNKDEYIARVNVSGSIDPATIKTINCNYSFKNHPKSSLKITYLNNIKKLNDVKNIFKQNDKFLLFYVEIKDTFIAEEESWDIDVLNLCQDYDIQILLPPGKRLKDVKFVNRNADNKEVLVEDIQPILIQEINRQKIILQIMNVDKNDHYKIIWS